MKYIALLRGINAGKLRRVDMKKLKALFEALEFKNVSTYLNSGNVVFESERRRKETGERIRTGLNRELGFDIPTLVKTEKEVKRIAEAIPEGWRNDAAQRSDVAFLFPEIDRGETLGELPVNRKYLDIRYTKGAIYWNLDRKDNNKSRLNRIVGHPLYQLMTLRNVSTTRYLAGKRENVGTRAAD